MHTLTRRNTTTVGIGLLSLCISAACSVQSDELEMASQNQASSIPGMGFCDEEVQDVVTETLFSNHPYRFAELTKELESRGLVDHGSPKSPENPRFYELEDEYGLLPYIGLLAIYTRDSRLRALDIAIAPFEDNSPYVRFNYELLDNDEQILRYVELFDDLHNRTSPVHRCGNICSNADEHENEVPLLDAGKFVHFSSLDGPSDEDAFNIRFQDHFIDPFYREVAVTLQGLSSSDITSMRLSNIQCESGDSQIQCLDGATATEDGGCEVLGQDTTEPVSIRVGLRCRDTFIQRGTVRLDIVPSAAIDTCTNYGIMID